MTLTDLTAKDIQILTAALALIAPTGGGSNELNLLHRIRQQTPEIAHDEYLECIYSTKIIDEAKEAGVI